MSSKPEILSIRRADGVAGQYALTASVKYPGEAASNVTFYGSVYGGPIIMATPGPGLECALCKGPCKRETQVFVSSEVTARLGETLSEQWVRAFFTPRGSE